MPNIFFTSDHHFGHGNIIKYCDRPFGNVHEMNKAYTDTWNSQVSRNDTVYHLGDFTFGDPTLYLSKLKGSIKIIPGNHDSWARKNKFQKIESMHGLVEILPLIHVLRISKDVPPIVMCHYPLRSWPHSNHGSWHLHGHSHKALDHVWFVTHVGVDGNDGRLWSLEAIRRRMAKFNETIKRSR